MTIQPIELEIFQSGANWWTNIATATHRPLAIISFHLWMSFSLFFSGMSEQDPWYKPMERGDSAELECFRLLTQPLKFWSCHTAFSSAFHYPSCFTPSSSSSSSEPPLPPLSCLLWWRHTTACGQRWGQSISPTLLSAPPSPICLSSHLFHFSPLILQPLPSWVFPSKLSAGCVCLSVCDFFSLMGAALASNLSSGLM